jgi:hypothetical protein
VTARIRPDAVYLVHGYGHRARELRYAHGRGIDDTELITRYRTDPIMGGTGMNVNFVTFQRAADVETTAAPGGAHASLVARRGCDAATERSRQVAACPDLRAPAEEVRA